MVSKVGICIPFKSVKYYFLLPKHVEYGIRYAVSTMIQTSSKSKASSSSRNSFSSIISSGSAFVFTSFALTGSLGTSFIFCSAGTVFGASLLWEEAGFFIFVMVISGFSFDSGVDVTGRFSGAENKKKVKNNGYSHIFFIGTKFLFKSYVPKQKAMANKNGFFPSRKSRHEENPRKPHSVISKMKDPLTNT